MTVLLKSGFQKESEVYCLVLPVSHETPASFYTLFACFQV